MCKNESVGTEVVAQLVQCLTSMHKTLSSVPSLRKPDTGIHSYNLSTQEVGAGGSSGTPQLHGEFKASLRDMRPCLKAK